MKYIVFCIAFYLVSFSSHAQEKEVLNVHLSAYPLASSTLIGVDSIQIQQSAPLNTKIKHGAILIRQLEQALCKKDTITLDNFKSKFVRFFFKITLKEGSRSIYLAQGSSLLYRGKLYKLDNELKIIIRNFIPNKDEYLPLKAINRQ